MEKKTPGPIVQILFKHSEPNVRDTKCITTAMERGLQMRVDVISAYFKTALPEWCKGTMEQMRIRPKEKYCYSNKIIYENVYNKARATET